MAAIGSSYFFPVNRHTYRHVFPTLHEGTLNFGLDLEHYQTGYYVTSEFVAAYQAKGQGYFHSNLLTGIDGHRHQKVLSERDVAQVARLQTTPHPDKPTAVRVVTLQPGQAVFRFASSTRFNNNTGVEEVLSDEARWTGPWWTTKMGFENMLARLDRSVRGGAALPLDQYARRYSAVLKAWSNMDVVGVAVVQRPVRCFLGMGAMMHAGHDEVYRDRNVQLYIPNLALYKLDGRELHIQLHKGPPGAPGPNDAGRGEVKHLRLLASHRVADVDRTLTEMVQRYRTQRPSNVGVSPALQRQAYLRAIVDKLAPGALDMLSP